MLRSIPSRFALALLLGAGVSLSTACGIDGPGPGGADGGGDDAGTTAEPVELDDLPTRASESFCKTLYDCCNDQEVEAIAGRFFDLNPPDESECISDRKEYIRDEIVPEIQESIDEGRAEYNKVAMGLCYPKPEERACSDFPRTTRGGNVNACDAAIVPKVDPGGSCERDWECIDSSCEGGTCTNPASSGSDCRGTACESKLYCDTSDGVCRPEGSLGDDCDGDRECRTKHCAKNDDGNEICAPKKDGGDTCDDDAECTSGYCHDDNPLNDGNCLPTPVCDDN